MSAPTPTPWRVLTDYSTDRETEIITSNHVIAQVKHFSDEFSDFARLTVVDGEDKKLTDVKTSVGRANAARIVQCVNEHDGLIEQIESLRTERDGLVEALRNAQDVLVSEGWIVTGVYETLAKYEKS